MYIFPNQLFVPMLAASAQKWNNCGLLCREGAAHLGLTGNQELHNTAPRDRDYQEDREEHQGSEKRRIK